MKNNVVIKNEGSYSSHDVCYLKDTCAIQQNVWY